jgi:hypothetical protein
VKLVRLMSYVLMSRVQRIVANMWEANGQAAVDMWRGLLLEQRGERIIGHACSRRIQQEVAELRMQMMAADARSRSFAHIEQRIRELGLDPDDPGSLEKAIEGLRDDRELVALRQNVVYHARVLLQSAGNPDE